jgi:hypothetical protein
MLVDFFDWKEINQLRQDSMTLNGQQQKTKRQEHEQERNAHPPIACVSNKKQRLVHCPFRATFVVVDCLNNCIRKINVVAGQRIAEFYF